MQARFLANLVRDYQQTCQLSLRGKQTVHDAGPVVAEVQEETDVNGRATATTAVLDNSQPAACSLENDTIFPSTDLQRLNFPVSGLGGTSDIIASNWILEHDECWTNMLMNAGFDVGEGVFLPENSDA